MRYNLLFLFSLYDQPKLFLFHIMTVMIRSHRPFDQLLLNSHENRIITLKHMFKFKCREFYLPHRLNCGGVNLIERHWAYNMVERLKWMWNKRTTKKLDSPYGINSTKTPLNSVKWSLGKCPKMITKLIWFLLNKLITKASQLISTDLCVLIWIK